MAHTFSVTIPENMDLLAGVDKVRTGILDAGGKYSFANNRGEFEVKGVAGAFLVVGRVVSITLTKKPFIVSYAYVEKTIRGYFSAT